MAAKLLRSHTRNIFKKEASNGKLLACDVDGHRHEAETIVLMLKFSDMLDKITSCLDE